MSPYDLDAADPRILRELQQDGALRNDLLSEKVALTPAPRLRRVRALENAGVISRYAALFDPERVGLGVRVKVDVRLASRCHLSLDADHACRQTHDCATAMNINRILPSRQRQTCGRIAKFRLGSGNDRRTARPAGLA